MRKIIKNNDIVLAGFSLGATLSFIFGFFRSIYGGMTRSIVFIGPDKLCDIPWIRYSIVAIAVGVVFGICFYEIEQVERKKGKKTHIPRIKFKNFGLAILFFSVVFFGFLFIFVIREYHVRLAEISYLYRVSFLQFCGRYIPWPEILMTSLIFGIILAMGFSDAKTGQKNSVPSVKSEE